MSGIWMALLAGAGLLAGLVGKARGTAVPRLLTRDEARQTSLAGIAQSRSAVLTYYECDVIGDEEAPCRLG